MRTIQVKVLTFNELSDAAKEVARDWWRTAERSYPAWLDEHHDSMKAALKHRSDANALKDSAEGNWTGYTADGVFADNWDGTGDVPAECVIRSWYADAFESELESRMSVEYVDDAILANDYEFYESGKNVSAL